MGTHDRIGFISSNRITISLDVGSFHKTNTVSHGSIENRTKSAFKNRIKNAPIRAFNAKIVSFKPTRVVFDASHPRHPSTSIVRR